MKIVCLGVSRPYGRRMGELQVSLAMHRPRDSKQIKVWAFLLTAWFAMGIKSRRHLESCHSISWTSNRFTCWLQWHIETLDCTSSNQKTKKWPNRIQGTRHHAKTRQGGTHKQTLLCTTSTQANGKQKSSQFQNLVVVRCTCHTLYNLGEHRISSGH